MHISPVHKGIICGVTMAGIGVMATAALAEDLGLRKKDGKEKEEEFEFPSLLEMDLELPAMPASKDELLSMWASGYENVKKPLSAVFRVAGQMLVAPIAMMVIDTSYAKYLEYAESRGEFRVTAR